MVTIAIPFYNAEKYLEKAIQSVLSQTYTDWYLLLLDDGSSDRSLSIAQRYEGSRIKVISDGFNKNLGYRLNQIPILVKTKFLARMDADDIMHPERIERQLNILESNPDIDVLGTNAYTINEFDEVVGVRYDASTLPLLSRVEGFIHPTIMARTEWFMRNIYDVNAVRIEDAELWFRTAEHNNFQLLSQPLLFYREFGEDYYRKYFKAYRSLIHAFGKSNYSIKWLKFSIKYFISGQLYYLFNLVGKESILIRRRNKKSLEKCTIEEVLAMQNNRLLAQ